MTTMTSRDDKYSVLIRWSVEDCLFVATIPELPGVSAHGTKRKKALKEVLKALKLALAVMAE